MAWSGPGMPAGTGGLTAVGVQAVFAGGQQYVAQAQAATAATNQLAAATTNVAKRSETGTFHIIKFVSAMAGIYTAGRAARHVLIETIGAAIKFDTGFTSVRKTVEGTEAQLNQLKQDFRDLAKEIPVPIGELLKIGEAAGQLGIARESVIAFTTTVAMLGATTNLVSEDAARFLGKFAAITGATDQDFEKIGATLVDLGNKTAATETEIAKLSLRLAGAGSIVGLTNAEILAISATLASVGLSAEAAGSAFSRVFITLENAARSGGKAAQEFADIMKIPLEQFIQLQQTDPGAALTAFVRGLKQVTDEGGNTFRVLQDLGLSEIRVRLALLNSSQAAEKFADNMELANTQYKQANALSIEFARRNESSAAKIQKLANAAADVGITFGQAVLPSLIQMGTGLVRIIEALEPLAPAFGQVAAILPTVVTAFVALGIAIGLIKLIGLIQGLSTLIPTLLASTQALFGMTAATTAAGVATTSAIPALAVFAIAVAALDLGVKTLTDHHLIEWFTGTAQAAERSEKFLAKYGDSQQRLNDLIAAGAKDPVGIESMDIAAKLVDHLAESINNLNETEQKLAKAGWQSFDPVVTTTMERETAKLAETTKRLVAEFTTLKPTLEQVNAIIAIYPQLAKPLNDYLVRMQVATDKAALSNKAFAGSLEQTEEELVKAKEKFSDLFSDILPNLDKSTADIKKELASLTQAWINESGNIEFLQQELAKSGIDNLDDIIAAISSKGPQYLAQFTEWFNDNPTEILKLFGIAAPQIAEEAGLDIISALENPGANSAQAMRDGITGPAMQQLQVDAESMMSFAQTAARIIANAFTLTFPDQTGKPSPFFDTIKLPIIKPSNTLNKPGAKSGGGSGKEDLSAIDEFIKNAEERIQQSALEKIFGEAGAKAIMAFNNAIITKEGSDGEAAFKSITDMIDKAKEDNVPHAEALGAAVIEAAIRAFREGTPEAAYAFQDAVYALTGGTGAVDVGRAFADALAGAEQHERLVVAMTDLGAAAWEALMEAIKDPTEDNGAAVGEAISKLIQSGRDAGIPNIEARGKELGELFAAALAEGVAGGPATQRLQFALIILGQALTAKANGIAADVGKTFGEAFATALGHNDLVRRVGTSGARLIEALTIAIRDKKIDAINAVADMGADIINELLTTEGITVATAIEYGTRLTAAIKLAIETGTPGAIKALDDLLAEIDAKLKRARTQSSATQTLPSFTPAITNGGENGNGPTGPSAEDLAQNRIDEYNYLGDAIMEALRRQYDEEENAQLESINAQREALEKWIDDQIELRSAPLQAELDAMEKVEVDNREIDIRRRLALAYSAKDRAKIQQELDDFLRDKRRKEIRDELEKIRDGVNEEAQIKQDALDAEEEQIRNHYEFLLSQANLQAQALLLIQADNQQAMLNLIEEFYPDWLNAGISIGEQLVHGLQQSGIADTIAGLISGIDSIVDRLNPIGSGSGGGGNGGGGGSGGGMGSGGDPLPGGLFDPRDMPGFTWENGGLEDFLAWIEWVNGGGTVGTGEGPPEPTGSWNLPSTGTSSALGDPYTKDATWKPYDMGAYMMGRSGAQTSNSDNSVSVNVDLRGATLAGSPTENARAIQQAVEKVIDDQLNRGAFLAGVR